MTTPHGPTVMIVDDHPVFRRGLRGVLEDTGWVGAVVEATGVEDAVRTAVVDRVDIVAMDLQLPDGSGLDATARIRQVRPQTAVLILTMDNDAALPGQALAAGARGCLVKEVDGDLIADALHAISRGALVLGPHVDPAALTVRAPPASRPPSVLDQLTTRERELLAELAAGRSNLQIGRRLGLTEKTVRNQLSAVYAKLGVGDRTQAALLAREAGITGEASAP